MVHVDEESTDSEAGPDDVGPGESFTSRLNYLFETRRDADGEPFTNNAVLAGISDAGEGTISRGYLSELRNGIKDNPTIKHVEALANFFGVDPSYFITEEGRARERLAEAMQSFGVRDLALRAEGVSSQSLNAVADILDRLGELERREREG